ncbi:MAG: hypothetical protein EBZ48_02065, partial [Proteobacteria bacterium]|nr:hypothetical protein [Pseudomonadota bacterium]
LRLRDWLGILLFAAALLSSQFFMAFVPAFLYAASGDYRRRGQFLLWSGVFYLIGQGTFIYQYSIGPSDLFRAATIEGKVMEWLAFQPPEAGRLALFVDPAVAQSREPATRLAAILQSSMQSVTAFGGGADAVLALWCGLGAIGIVMSLFHSIRRDIMTAGLIAVPLLAIIYLQSYVVMNNYLPLSLAVALLGAAFAGFMAKEFPGLIGLTGVATVLCVVLPVFIWVNYATLLASSTAERNQGIFQGLSVPSSPVNIDHTIAPELQP